MDLSFKDRYKIMKPTDTEYFNSLMELYETKKNFRSTRGIGSMATNMVEGN